MLAKVYKSDAGIRFASFFAAPANEEIYREPESVFAPAAPESFAFAPADESVAPESFGSNEEIVPFDAQASAEQVIAQAERDREMIFQAAREKGLQEAQATIEAEVAAQVEQMRGELAATIAQISGLHDEVIARAETDLVELALEIAKKIVGREVTIDRDIALTLVKVSLKKIHQRTAACVHLNPEDFAYVSAHRERIDFHGSLELVEDRSVSPGGCLVRTENGDVDARVESQFEEIAYALLGQ